MNVGVFAQPQSIHMTPCDGDEVMYNCSVDSTTHGWAISGDSSRVSILDSDGFREASIGPFMFRLEDTDPLVSSVSVVAHAELSGTVVTCVDADGPETGGMEVNITVLSKQVNKVYSRMGDLSTCKLIRIVMGMNCYLYMSG